MRNKEITRFQMQEILKAKGAPVEEIRYVLTRADEKGAAVASIKGEGWTVTRRGQDRYTIS